MANDNSNGRLVPAPTLQEIQERSAVVRAEWSEAEHYRRAGLRVPGWCDWEGTVTAHVATFGDGVGEPHD
jgi:hypothetical protein